MKRKYDAAGLNEELLKVLRNPNDPKSFALSLITELTPFGTIKNYGFGEYVLKTGDQNHSIFFLLEGFLDIMVDGEIVASLKRKGDIVGEMSIIAQNICTADVISRTDSRLLIVPVTSLKQKSSDYELLLYKIFCLTLSEKLENTNIKARNFETLNRTLEDEVNKRTQEVKIGFKKLESLHDENMQILSSLTHLDENLIKASLHQIDQGNLEAVKNNLKLIQKTLSPLQQLKTEHEQLEGQRVLVVESNTKQRNLIKIALGGTGVQVDMAKSLEEAMELLAKNPSILFLGADMLEVADYVKANQIKTKIVLCTEEESKDYLAKIKNYGFLSNIIATKADDRAFNIKSIATTVAKMTGGNIFGLEKYLNWGAEVKEFDIRDSKERQNLNDKVIEHLTDLGIRSALRTRCQIVIEELLMNAIYDAPTDKNGKPLHNFKSRTEQIILEENQKAKLRFGTDGLFLAISVEDPFGAFKKETIFKYLENNYFAQTNEEHEKSGKGGAGKGIFMVTESSDLVIYNVSKGVKTEVIALFDLDPAKEKKTTSIHYFEL